MPRGRPKGSKNKSTASKSTHSTSKSRKLKTKSTDVQTVSDNSEEQEQEIQTDSINPFEITLESCECEFENITEWASVVKSGEEKEKTKFGIYSSCRLPIKNAKKVYPVVAYIKTNIDKYRTLGYTDKQIYVGCINYLSKNQSKNKLKKIGDLYPFSFKIISNKISAMFLTTEQKSKMFWGEGTK